MIRRLLVFVLGPLGLSYLLTSAAQTSGLRTAGVHWLAAVSGYIFFALPGLLLAIWLGRHRRRDWVEAGAALSAMAIGSFTWASLSYREWFFTLGADGARRYSFIETSVLALRDSLFNTALAAAVLGVCVITAKLIEVAIRSASPNVR